MLSNLLEKYNVTQYSIVNNFRKSLFLNEIPIYVINLKQDFMRRCYIKHLFKKHRINYTLVVVDKFRYDTPEETIEHKIHHTKMGCILSHLWCISDAVKKNSQRFIVFEDDIIFHKQFFTLFQNMLINCEIPDLLMLGSIDFKIEEHTKDMNESCPIYYPKNNIIGAHANMYTLQFARSFLEYKLNSFPIKEFDYDYAIFMDKFKIGICCPNLVVCELSTTNINHFFSPLKKSGFSWYSKTFKSGFTYNDYEYIIIAFLTFIFNYEFENKTIKAVTINKSIEQYLELFISKYNTSHIPNMQEWILNSGYTTYDLINIVKYLKSDTFFNNNDKI